MLQVIKLALMVCFAWILLLLQRILIQTVILETKTITLQMLLLQQLMEKLLQEQSNFGYWRKKLYDNSKQ
ncbi:hypothetical protein AXK30_08325 [Escherichia coli]|nr:hypothetical protein AXK30_08325 [Escherichia coli]